MYGGGGEFPPSCCSWITVRRAMAYRMAQAHSEVVPASHRKLPLSLTFDHRVVNGGEALRFLAAMVADLTRTD